MDPFARSGDSFIDLIRIGKVHVTKAKEKIKNPEYGISLSHRYGQFRLNMYTETEYQANFTINFNGSGVPIFDQFSGTIILAKQMIKYF